jgi:phage baseplate assembly protein W
MQGYSPKLPLLYDASGDGLYGLNKTMVETIRQNLKMLLLTNPGERIMDSNFGVGLRKFVFEQDTNDTRSSIRGKIIQQVKSYLPYIQLDEINMSEPGSNNENILFLNIKYSVPSLNIKDELNINS